MHPDTRYVTIDGARIAYQVFGHAPPTLLVSAGSFSHTDAVWEDPAAAAFFARLSTFTRVVRYDRLGTSNSDPFPPTWDPTWEGYVKELEAVLSVVDVSRVSLLATLDAGPVALRFAKSRPDMIERLILFNTTARFLEADGYPIGLQSATYAGIIERVRETWGTQEQVSMNVPSRVGDEAFTAWYGKYSRAIGTPNTMADALERMSTLDSRDCLAELPIPTLVIHRAHYALIPAAHGRYVADHTPGATYLEVPGRDGPMFWETSDLILSHIHEFLAGVSTQEPPPPRVATVLFTDIVGSTDRLRQLGDSQWTAVIGLHEELAARTVDELSGWLVKSTGDGILAVFPHPESAIEAARRIRQLLVEMGIQIRSGIHTGRVETTENDVGGLAVNIAARVMAHAPDGQIAVSRTVRDLLLGSNYQLDFLGSHQLKGIDGEWDLYRLT